MRFTRLIGLELLVFGLAAAAGAQTPPSCSASTSEGPLVVTVTSPLPGSVQTPPEPCCEPTLTVTGTASVGFTLFDFYFVIDSSGSTRTCSGSDIDGDGVIGVFDGFECSDPDDTVLATEIAAVRGFVETLDPLTSRVAIIQFSSPEGVFGGGERQRIVQALTSDFALVYAGLDDVFLGGSSGATDYGGGLGLVRTEFLTNGDPAFRRQNAYFLSDGVPTYPVMPYSSEEAGDSMPAIDAADLLAGDGLIVTTFGVGFFPSTTLDPVLPERCRNGDGVLVSTLECVALRTGGDFLASRDPAEIIDALLRSIPDLGIADVNVLNETNGALVVATLFPDGSWTAELPAVAGVINMITATGTASDGTACDVLTDVDIICGGVAPGLFTALPWAPRDAAGPGSPGSPADPCAPTSPGSPSSSGAFWLWGSSGRGR